MRPPRIALALTAATLLFAACDRTPTGGIQPPPSARHDDEPPPPPPIQPDTTGRGGGVKGSGG